MKQSVKCAFCNNLTTDPTGRCYLHIQTSHHPVPSSNKVSAVPELATSTTPSGNSFIPPQPQKIRYVYDDPNYQAGPDVISLVPGSDNCENCTPRKMCRNHNQEDQYFGKLMGYIDKPKSYKVESMVVYAQSTIVQEDDKEDFQEWAFEHMRKNGLHGSVGKISATRDDLEWWSQKDSSSGGVLDIVVGKPRDEDIAYLNPGIYLGLRYYGWEDHEIKRWCNHARYSSPALKGESETYFGSRSYYAQTSDGNMTDGWQAAAFASYSEWKSYLGEDDFEDVISSIPKGVLSPRSLKAWRRVGVTDDQEAFAYHKIIADRLEREQSSIGSAFSSIQDFVMQMSRNPNPNSYSHNMITFPDDTDAPLITPQEMDKWIDIVMDTYPKSRSTIKNSWDLGSTVAWLHRSGVRDEEIPRLREIVGNKEFTSTTLIDAVPRLISERESGIISDDWYNAWNNMG